MGRKRKRVVVRHIFKDNRSVTARTGRKKAMNAFCRIVSALLFLAVPVCTPGVCADATVTRGSGPDFPLYIDSAFLFVWLDPAGTSDSLVTALSASIYADLRDNIDSMYNYATALSLKRKELSGCGRGPKYGSCLSFTVLGTTAVKVLFSCGNYSSAKVVTATDRYPFVVKFTKGFSEKLRNLAKRK
jgi:hypothetical protein